MQFRTYMGLCVLCGCVSAMMDWHLNSPNYIPFMTGGTGLFGGLAYVLLLILGKGVE